MEFSLLAYKMKRQVRRTTWCMLLLLLGLQLGGGRNGLSCRINDGDCGPLLEHVLGRKETSGCGNLLSGGHLNALLTGLLLDSAPRAAPLLGGGRCGRGQLKLLVCRRNERTTTSSLLEEEGWNHVSRGGGIQRPSCCTNGGSCGHRNRKTGTSSCSN